MTVNRINWKFDLTLTDLTRVVQSELSVSWKLINMSNLGQTLLSDKFKPAFSEQCIFARYYDSVSSANKNIFTRFWCSFFSGDEDRMTAAGDISIKSQSRDERVNVYKYPDNSFFPADSWSMVPTLPRVSPRPLWFSSLFSLIFSWLSGSLVSEQCQTLSRCIVEWEQNIRWLNDMLLNINCPPFISN